MWSFEAGEGFEIRDLHGDKWLVCLKGFSKPVNSQLENFSS